MFNKIINVVILDDSCSKALRKTISFLEELMLLCRQGYKIRVKMVPETQSEEPYAIIQGMFYYGKNNIL